MPESVDTCIIGSGHGGLSIARRLEEAGTDYVVLDKGRTPGGRAATRRFADSRFDHGLPWLTDQGPMTRELVTRGVEAGVLEELEVPGEGSSAWYSPAGISALGKHLAADLNVRNRVRVTQVRQQDDRLLLTCETDGEETELEVTGKLFVTAPLPQALDLLEPLVGDSLRPPSEPYRNGIVAMVQADPGSMNGARSGRLIPEYLKFPDVKPGFSLRLSDQDSERLFDEDEDRIKTYVAETLDAALPAEDIQLMKWRYANGSGAVEEPFFEAASGPVPILICGDSFFGGTASGIEASLMSCLAAYEAPG